MHSHSPDSGEITRDAVSGALLPLARASTLPAPAFTSPRVYEREIERLFRREWLCAGRVDQIPESGDYMCLDLLGARLVVVRDHDGRVRVLSRICRHRAADLVGGSGNTRSFQCPYHAWTFALDGRLVGAPHMDGVEGFERSDCGLPELRSELWEGWIFVNFDPEAAPLAPRLAPLAKLLARYDMQNMVAVETATYDSPFNWKVLVDNFMEAYHHIATHEDTLEPLFPGAASYTPDNEGPYSALFMPTGENVRAVEAARATGEKVAFDGLVAAVVYPFHLFAPSHDLLAWYQILPESVDRFTLRIFNCFPRAHTGDPARRPAIEDMQALTKTIHEQDIGACESVWSGLTSGSFGTGRLSLLEKPTWQFNHWWAERMTDPD